VLDPDTQQLGYLLLRCIRCYVEFEMYAGLEVHTTETIEAGRKSLARFEMFMEKYIKKASGVRDKNWNFPKKHLARHLFDDIEAKGAARNFDSKFNEKLHGPLKKSYQRRTNFKNVAGQILRIDHWNLVSEYISAEIATYDSWKTCDSDDWLSIDEEEANIELCTAAMIHHVQLGSKQKMATFDFIENTYASDEAFHRFRIKFNTYLNQVFRDLDIPLPGGRPIELHPNDMITEFRFLKVQYESMVDWRQYTDYLRCSPKFYNAERHDCVIVKTEAGVIFARLILMFDYTISSSDSQYPTALIHPFDASVGRRLRKDKHFDFWRVKPQPRASSCFISMRSIIRGAALAQDPATGDFLVIDTIDNDMFLRMKKLHAEAGHGV